MNLVIMYKLFNFQIVYLLDIFCFSNLFLDNIEKKKKKKRLINN